jgi:hypothetical protein
LRSITGAPLRPSGDGKLAGGRQRPGRLSSLVDDPSLKRFRAALDEIYGERLERAVIIKFERAVRLSAFMRSRCSFFSQLLISARKSCRCSGGKSKPANLIKC